MRRRGLSMALAVLLLTAALLSGALLILHAGHECHQAACPVCAALTGSTESLLCLLVAAAGIGLHGGMNRYCPCPPGENRFEPDWTPVRRKVKLQD